MKDTLIQTLLDNKICFSVAVATNKFKMKSLRDHASLDYFVIIYKDDVDTVKEFFPKSKHKENILIDMSKIDVSIFRDNKAKFNQVQHDESGSIYELKRKSYKKYYERKVKK